MAYNGRMSMARSTAPSSHGRSQSKKQAEADNCAFALLPEDELAKCIQELGIPLPGSDLTHLKPEHAQRIFEWFAELLSMTTRDVVAPGMRAAAVDMCGDDEADRLFTADTRELMGFFVMLRRLLFECGVQDFTFSDLFHPSRPRMARIFSCVINFVRFRESQTGVIDEHFATLDGTKDAIERLYASNQAKTEQLASLRANRATVQQELRDKEKRAADLTAHLRQLQRDQERLIERFERARVEQSRLKSVLEERHSAAAAVRKDADKLRPYTQQSPAALEASLRALGASLGSDKAEIERLERRERALKTSADSFGVAQADVAAVSKALGEVQAELRAEDEQASAAGRMRDALSERSANVIDVENRERLLRKQLASWTERTALARQGAEEKQGLAQRRMEELKGVHEELGRERRVRGEEVERRRVRIETVEKKMAVLKEDIENEVQSARDEYMKMESHIQLYITEMEKTLAC